MIELFCLHRARQAEARVREAEREKEVRVREAEREKKEAGVREVERQAQERRQLLKVKWKRLKEEP